MRSKRGGKVYVDEREVTTLARNATHVHIVRINSAY